MNYKVSDELETPENILRVKLAHIVIIYDSTRADLAAVDQTIALKKS